MGGRGVSSFTNRNPQSQFSNGLGTTVAATLKEAIGTKGKPDSIAQAAKNSNPLFSRQYSEYSENCQRAVVAYELRRRGYKVFAQPTYKGDTLGLVVHVDKSRGVLNSRWSRAFQHAKTENVGGRTGEKMISAVDRKMASFGNGSRAVLQVQWKSGGAHVFNVERQGGRTVYIDAQVNRRYTSSYVSKNVKPGTVNIVRTDNLRISERAKDSVTTRRY